MSGERTLVAEHTLTIASCAPPAAREGGTNVVMMALGDDCILRGTLAPYGLSAEPGVCTLDFQEGRRSVSFSSVSVVVPTGPLLDQPAWTKNANYPGLGVTMTGKDVATGREVLYRLTIRTIAANDDGRQLLCDRTRGPALSSP
jgi:hypothetical protein